MPQPSYGKHHYTCGEYAERHHIYREGLVENKIYCKHYQVKERSSYK